MKMRSNGTANISGGSSSKIYTNKTILTTDWVSDTTYNDYPYKAVVTCTNITPEDFVEVELEQVSSLSPFVVTDDNSVYFFASEILSEDIVVTSIVSTTPSYGEYGFVVTASDDNAEGKTVTVTEA